tara:strand:+ start:2260 stop:2457 length:198 start_codon:yes stop_codon:yes gene_type:complete
MGWMKQIYVMCQDGTFDQEFTKKYKEALVDQKDSMYFDGMLITMDQAEGIATLAKDVNRVFKKET